jgi:hypothetical protein
MDREEWARYLTDEATLYNMIDAAIALVGEPTDVPDDAQPTLIIRARHVETEMPVTFTFNVPHWLVKVFAGTFSRMSWDIDHDTPLNESDNPTLEF